MSSINVVQGSYYSLVYDAATAGGVRIDSEAAQYKAQVYTVSFSERSLALAQDVAAMRDAAAQQLSAAERYAAALAFGSDYCSSAGNASERSSMVVDSFYGSTSFTATSKEGTVIGISSLHVADEESGKSLTRDGTIQTIQITRQDGLQINLPLNENLRINDLENGELSIYFAQSGITKIYDADGNETVIGGEGELGTTGNDIIININSSFIDGNDGDDIIINMSNNSTILGGGGNDTIIVGHVAHNQNINGGEGDDIIAGYILNNSNFVLDNNDKLTVREIRDSNLVMDGSSNFVASAAINSSITTLGEQAYINIDSVHNINMELNASTNYVVVVQT